MGLDAVTWTVLATAAAMAAGWAGWLLRHSARALLASPTGKRRRGGAPLPRPVEKPDAREVSDVRT